MLFSWFSLENVIFCIHLFLNMGADGFTIRVQLFYEGLIANSCIIFYWKLLWIADGVYIHNVFIIILL